MAVGRGADDCGDCQQWHALAALEFGCRWYRPRCDLDRIPWYLRDLYQLDLNPIQAPPS